MTTTQPKLSSIAAKYIPPRRKFFSLIGTFTRSHLGEVITASIALSLILFGASTWNAWNVYRSFTNKQIYAVGTENTLTNIKKEVNTQLQVYSQRLLWSVIFAAISFLVLLLSWLSVVSVVRAYIRERDQAQRSLLASQSALLKSNEELEQRTQQIYAQEQATKQDNEILQSDVIELLEIVSALEAGDLTIQASVNDRATGLVADTFNRLSEELARVMSTALSTAQQVAQGAKDLEGLAVTTALHTQQQAQSVVEVQALIKDVNNVSQNTAQQTVAVDEAVERAQAAVIQGMQEMTAMTTGIEVLHHGTDQIVKRAQALTDFVELAAQFAKNQKRVASMTRVLALNASLLSARASGQQDPEQFASVAREFETVATQVNDLAVQTNQSLILLQQRTDQIQTVVSGLNQDVQDINQLVNDFTVGVGQSRQVFDNIKTATEQVAEVEQQVTQSSQAIALAAQTTLKSIQ